MLFSMRCRVTFFDLQQCMGRSAEVRAVSPIAAAEVALRQMLDRDLFLTDFGNEGKVEVICPIEHSLSLAAVAERLKRETAEGIHRVA
jgi:hypothetical protein